MSWEYSKYEAVCKQCGHQGFCIEGSDDWGRSCTWWEGFNGRPSSPTAVGRMKASADSHGLMLVVDQACLNLFQFVRSLADGCNGINEKSRRYSRPIRQFVADVPYFISTF